MSSLICSGKRASTVSRCLAFIASNVVRYASSLALASSPASNSTSVIPPKADITARSWVSFASDFKILITLIIFSALATDVPPNLSTFTIIKF